MNDFYTPAGRLKLCGQLGCFKIGLDHVCLHILKNPLAWNVHTKIDMKINGHILYCFIKHDVFQKCTKSMHLHALLFTPQLAGFGEARQLGCPKIVLDQCVYIYNFIYFILCLCAP